MPAARQAKSRTYVREWRAFRGMSCQDIASITGLTQGAISHVERGARGYRQDTLEAIASALGCTPVDLLSGPPGADRQPGRPHYVQAWAEASGYRRAVDLVNAIGADKGLVSRWYAGTTPSKQWQRVLAASFGCSTESLFRHPNEEWLADVFRGRTPDEIARIKIVIDAAFPRARRAAGAK